MVITRTVEMHAQLVGYDFKKKGLPTDKNIAVENSKVSNDYFWKTNKYTDQDVFGRTNPGHIVAVHLVNAVHGRGQRAHDLSVLLHRAPSSGKNPVSDHTIIRNRIFVKGDFPFS